MTPFELFIVQYGNYPFKIISTKNKEKTKQNKAKKKKKQILKRNHIRRLIIIIFGIS